MEWLFTFLIVAFVVVVYVAVQKNSPDNRQARAANEALSRVGVAWDRAPADQRNQILLEVGVDSASARNAVIVRAWSQLGIQFQTTIALRPDLVDQFLGTRGLSRGQDTTDVHTKTDEMFENYSLIKRKFPGVIPRRGTAIGDFALEIAGDLGNRFSKPALEQFLEGQLLGGFSPGWTESVALSRWYALGFICLIDCLQTSQWTESLTLDVGLKVHDATTELLWALWSPPEPVKEKVSTFMRQNIKEITPSLAGFAAPASRRNWFINYAERIKGANPPWDTRGGVLSQILAGEKPSTDVISGNFLMSHFGDARKSILDLVSGAKTGVSFSNLPGRG